MGRLIAGWGSTGTSHVKAVGDKSDATSRPLELPRCVYECVCVCVCVYICVYVWLGDSFTVGLDTVLTTFKQSRRTKYITRITNVANYITSRTIIGVRHNLVINPPGSEILTAAGG